MSMAIPAALRLDATGMYVVADECTSGGDIGAQIPIFPVIWVRR